ncbi:MAG: hypothetical protein WCO84_03130 [bacterium]
MLKNNRKNLFKNGFTTAELLVGIAIFVFIGMAVNKFQSSIFSSSSYLQASLRTEDDARRILRTIISEIRSMNYSAVGGYPITSATGNSFIFYSDTNNDNNTERLRYFIEGTNLKRGIVYPTGSPFSYDLNNEKISIITSNIVATSSIFSYFSDSYVGTGMPLPEPVNLPDVRLIKVSIPATIKTADGKISTSYEISSQVSIRNLKDNM